MACWMESVAQRQRLFCSAVTELGLPHHHAGKKCAQRKRHAEQRCRTKGNTHSRRHHAQGKQLARAGALNLPGIQGKNRRPTS